MVSDLTDQHNEGSNVPAMTGTTPIASAMIFGTVLFTTLALTTRSYLVGDVQIQAPSSSISSSSSFVGNNSLPSIVNLLYLLSNLGLILFYAYLCENHPPFSSSHETTILNSNDHNNNNEYDTFFFFILLLLLISIWTFKINGTFKVGETDMIVDGSIVKRAKKGNGNGNGNDNENGHGYGHDKEDLNTMASRNHEETNRLLGGNATGQNKAIFNNNNISVANQLFLNRCQTEEWKGWIQCLILLYDYCCCFQDNNDDKIKSASTICKLIFTSCYVWMTGYGNFSYFYIKADYSIVRILRMVWRMNFLVVCLCLIQVRSRINNDDGNYNNINDNNNGTTYIFYHVCFLHTYYFFMVYITMVIGHSRNYTSKWWLRMKLFILACIIFVVWDCCNVSTTNTTSTTTGPTAIFEILHRPLLFFFTTQSNQQDDTSITSTSITTRTTSSSSSSSSGSLWEWYYHSSLDHWSALFGMIFALNYPTISHLHCTVLEPQQPNQQQQPPPPQQPFLFLRYQMVKFITGFALLSTTLTIFYLFVIHPLKQQQQQETKTGAMHYYETIHAYCTIFPILTYIYIRNSTSWLRKRTSWILQQIGKSTLEMYVMKHHIWMTSNGNTAQLILLPIKWPMVNFLFVTALYIVCIRRLVHISYTLRDIILPLDNRYECFKNLIGMGLTFGGYCLLVILMKHIGMLTVSSIGIVSMLCGYGLYQSILSSLTKRNFDDDSTSNDKGENFPTRYNNNNNNSNNNKAASRSIVLTTVPILVSLFIVTAFISAVSYYVHMVGTSIDSRHYFSRYDDMTTKQKHSLLPSSCNVYANSGKWLSLNICDVMTTTREQQKQPNQQRTVDVIEDSNIMTESICSSQNSVHVWGWERRHEQIKQTQQEQEGEKQEEQIRQQQEQHDVVADDDNNNNLPVCNFHQRSINELLLTLHGRKIYFIGDSMTRYLYYSFCRQLGLTDAGSYNATGGKHHDIYETIIYHRNNDDMHVNENHDDGDSKDDNIDVNFYWASYAPQLLSKAKNLTSLLKSNHRQEDDDNNSSNNNNEKKMREEQNTKPDIPDVVLFGGGAWDRLWNYTTEVEQIQLGRTLTDLAYEFRQIRQLHVPVVWFVPTTINTDALKGDLKMQNINEKEMSVLRTLYNEKGILSSVSFVVDGPTFTTSRVAESFDGVHYPHSIYSAGAQIFANSLDWLLQEPKERYPHEEKSMKIMTVTSHPRLVMPNIWGGILILILVCIGLFAIDGFLGFSYLPSSIFIASKISPINLYKNYNNNEVIIYPNGSLSMTGSTNHGKSSPPPAPSTSPDNMTFRFQKSNMTTTMDMEDGKATRTSLSSSSSLSSSPVKGPLRHRPTQP